MSLTDLLLLAIAVTLVVQAWLLARLVVLFGGIPDWAVQP